MRIIKAEDVSIDTTAITAKTLESMSNEIMNLSKTVKTTSAARNRKAQEIKNNAMELKKAQINALTSITSNKFPIKIKNFMNVELTPDKDIKFEFEPIDVKEIKNKSEFDEWVDKVEQAYEIRYDEIDNNASAYDKEDVSSSDAASAFSALLADDTFNKIRELEKELEYRKFYFPGGTPQLKVVKEGETPPLGKNWDPRYLTDYIQAAKANGFHRWFLYLGGDNQTELMPCSFMMLWNEAKQAINWTTKKFYYEPSNELTSMFVGLKFFDKFDAWVDYIKGSTENNINITTDKVDWIYEEELSLSVKGDLMEVLTAYIGQTASEFKNNDVGYYTMLDSLAFDSSKILQQLTVYNEKYEQFKKELWAIIKKNPVLQLCTNNANITGNNINITQVMQCNQEIKELPADEDDEETDETDDDNQYSLKPLTTSSTTDDNNKQPAATDNQKENEEVKKSGFGISTIVIFVIIIISVILIVGYFIMSSRSETQEDKHIDGGLVVFV